ncbi:hypothetical protein CRENPOLYSF2_1550003 [Crenothrix polyspora]|uniref:Uncharacterized protein n=1 Tax=Crenothrix polyspora TaxID=360316 RepID=A0A1R4H2H3_9GAMM|nr:hypothetical protein CRENPOLYSF2_1550003 [Crenothrix polyspora]
MNTYTINIVLFLFLKPTVREICAWANENIASVNIVFEVTRCFA